MNNAKKISDSFFILSSSFEKIVERAKSLDRLSAMAYDHRNYKLLNQLAEEQLNLSAYSEQRGLYWQALGLCRQGRGDKANAVKIFEGSATTAPIPVRAAHLIALSNYQIILGDYKEATNFINEAFSVLTSPIDWVENLNSLSLVHSLEGDHEKSLELLRMIYPAACLLGRERPALVLDILNSAAYEHLSLGNVALAANLIKPVAASPIINRIPEWQATIQDINSALLERPLHSIIPVSGYRKSINNTFQSACEIDELPYFYFDELGLLQRHDLISVQGLPIKDVSISEDIIDEYKNSQPQPTFYIEELERPIKKPENILPFHKPDKVEIRFCCDDKSYAVERFRLKYNGGVILGLVNGIESVFTRQNSESHLRLQLILHSGITELQYHEIGIHPDDIEKLDETKRLAESSRFTVIEDEVISDELVVKRVTKQIIRFINEDEAKFNS